MTEQKKVNPLAGLQRLSGRVAVYMPSTVNVSRAADNSAQVERAAVMLSGLFGGATIQPGRGAWVSPSAGLVLEDTTIVYAFCDPSALEGALPEIVDFCKALKAEMTQDAIALEISGVQSDGLYFV